MKNQNTVSGACRQGDERAAAGQSGALHTTPFLGRPVPAAEAPSLRPAAVPGRDAGIVHPPLASTPIPKGPFWYMSESPFPACYRTGFQYGS